MAGIWFLKCLEEAALKAQTWHLQTSHHCPNLKQYGCSSVSPWRLSTFPGARDSKEQSLMGATELEYRKGRALNGNKTGGSLKLRKNSLKFRDVLLMNNISVKCISLSITSFINTFIKEPLNSGKDTSYSHFPDLAQDFLTIWHTMNLRYFKSKEALLRKLQRSKTTVSKGGVFSF